MEFTREELELLADSLITEIDNFGNKLIRFDEIDKYQEKLTRLVRLKARIINQINIDINEF